MIRFIGSFIVVLSFGQFASAIDVLIEDGGMHVIDDDAFTNVTVQNSNEGLTTTLNVEETGFITGNLDVRNDSIVNIRGLVSRSLIARHDSVVNVLGGKLGGLSTFNNAHVRIEVGERGSVSEVEARDDSIVRIFGTEKLTNISLFDNARLSMSGEIHSSLGLRGNSHFEGHNLNILFHRFETGQNAVADVHSMGSEEDCLARSETPDNRSVIEHCKNITAPKDIEAFQTSTINLFGGLFSDIKASHGSTINLHGGKLEGDIIISPEGTVNIYGSEFNYPFGPIRSVVTDTLVGTLADGSSLSARFIRGSTDAASLNLIFIPEPTSILPLVVLPLLGCRRRKRV